MERPVRRVRDFMAARDWLAQYPSNVAKSIAIEAAELLEQFQWSHDSVEDVKQNKAKLTEVSRELADVLIYAFEMAILLDLDVDTIVQEKLEMSGKKYPVALIKKWKKMGIDAAHTTYWKRKQKLRAKLKK
jgi:NTP pyrophosphatase (non-canonical NTP hydrolase)